MNCIELITVTLGYSGINTFKWSYVNLKTVLEYLNCKTHSLWFSIIEKGMVTQA